MAAGAPDLSSTPSSAAVIPHSSPLLRAMPFAAHKCQHTTAGGKLVLLSSPVSSEERTKEASTNLGSLSMERETSKRQGSVPLESHSDNIGYLACGLYAMDWIVHNY
ncbi:unnamed protein product [Urochloa humidicola]